jgi:hypothetical protein
MGPPVEGGVEVTEEDIDKDESGRIALPHLHEIVLMIESMLHRY